MPGLRISQLPAATTAASADLLALASISGSQTRKITLANIARILAQLGLSIGPTSPLTPYNGQVWVDTATSPPQIKTWDGVVWVLSSFVPNASISTNPGPTAPSVPSLGLLWQDTSQTPDQLKIYDGSNFVRVDPEGISRASGDARYLQIATAATQYLARAGGTMTGPLTLAGAPTTAAMAATKAYVDGLIAAIPAATDLTPPATIIWTARGTAPNGYLLANGAAVSRTTYAALFAAIGGYYGAGNGSTTFNVPDLRGEFVRGLDSGRGVDPGRNLGAVQGGEIQAHSHPVSDPGHSHPVSDPGHSHLWGTDDSTGVRSGSDSPDARGGTDWKADTSLNSANIGIQTASANIGIQAVGGAETRPRNIALLACIKT
jgi:microcystin-dependent protein